MKTLLLHPEDSPRRGPWASQKWDRIVDLGKSSVEVSEAWQNLFGCPVLRMQSLRRPIEDPRLAGQILGNGFGQLLDENGLDWWELTSLHIHAEVETAIALRRLVTETDLAGDLYATRPGWPVQGIALLLNREVRSFGSSSARPLAGRFTRAFKNLRYAQWAEIFWDKYDPAYEWRSRITRSHSRSDEAVVLLPSAYTNVSRGASEYARLLPERKFLLVATRNSGLQFEPPPNVSVARLASYAGGRKSTTSSLLQQWSRLRPQFAQIPELGLLERAGQLAPFARWLKAAPKVGDAWQAVLEREPVSGVLCGDDTNWYTRLPVILARKKEIPTVDFHHGAFDGRYLLKTLSSDLYLAKNEMERDYLTRICRLPGDRVVIGRSSAATSTGKKVDTSHRPNIIFFSEPYESVCGRPEEIYRELLPPLLRLAQDQECSLLLKLHPFESPRQRASLITLALGSKLAQNVTIVAGPLSAGLLDSARFGITVESSTVLDCAQQGIPCFQCEWLVATPFAYVQQFDRFRVGRLLRSPAEIPDIPRMLAKWDDRTIAASAAEGPLATDVLRQVFTGRPMAVSK